MLVWAVKIIDGKPQQCMHIAAVWVEPRKDYRKSVGTTPCGQEFAPGEWCDADHLLYDCRALIVCPDCAALTVQDVADFDRELQRKGG